MPIEKSSFRLASAVVLVGSMALWSVLGCPCEDSGPWDPADRCLTLEGMSSEVVPPAGVRAVLRAKDCDGAPLPDLVTEDLTILLDEETMRSEGETAPIITQEVEFEQYALILLDLSDSIVANNRLAGMVAAARDMADSLLSQEVAVAVYQFAGPPYFAEIQGFTRDAAKLDAAFDHLSRVTGLGSTDLYGAVNRSLSVLEQVGTADVLASRTLVLFTDGTDEAHSTPRSVAVERVASSDAYVFTVGLGGDVDKQELGELGKSGFEWVEDATQLSAAFAKVSQLVSDLARSYYLVAICSPRVGEERTMQIRLRHEGKWGELVVRYSAQGFDLVGCDPAVVAYPCEDRECGSMGSLSCGTCGDKELCNEDYICEDACGGFECGLSFGLSCGTCGSGLACLQHQCVDPCEQAQCGTIQGVSCGDCADLGATSFCDVDYTCVDACAGFECGLSHGLSCGDCDEGFGCDASHICVEACDGVECGEHLGVECGGCGNGLMCVSNTCEPIEVPGVSFVEVPGGQVRLGCDPLQDPACAVDELPRTVTLSNFEMLETEATVGMYEACLDAGACHGAELDSGDLCHVPFVVTSSMLPLNCVSWQGLRELCQFLGGDLPSEAQFERAMRGDHDGVTLAYWLYPWGNSPAPSCEVAVMQQGGLGCGTGAAWEVGSMPATTAGLYDLAGNVAEWTLDYYSDEASCSGQDCVDPTGPVSGSERVVRGGAFDDMYASKLRNAARDKRDPSQPLATIGGRCVRMK